MVAWFAILAVSGLAKVIENPAILKALSPSYGFAFFLDHPLIGFLALAAVVLVVTGSEALYADLRIRRKSGSEGQVYVPAVNWLLYIAVSGLVIGFGAAAALASAYGIAVTGTFAATTILFFAVMRLLWKKPLWIVVPGAAAFIAMDLAFFSANLTKVVAGGWFRLAIALIIFTLLSTWRRGRVLVTAKRSEAEGRLGDFVEEVQRMDPPLQRVPGTAVFLSAGKQTTPLALRANVDYNHVLHESVVIVSVETETVPDVDRADRVVADDLGYEDDGIIHLTVRYGFQDDQRVPAALRQAAAQGLPVKIDAEKATYFVSEITIVLGDDPGMRTWRKRLFLVLSRTSKSPVDFFGLPERRIVTMGYHIEL